MEETSFKAFTTPVSQKSLLLSDITLDFFYKERYQNRTKNPESRETFHLRPYVCLDLGARFSTPVQTGPGAHPTSYTMGKGLSRG